MGRRMGREHVTPVWTEQFDFINTEDDLIVYGITFTPDPIHPYMGIDPYWATASSTMGDRIAIHVRSHP